MRMSVLPPAVLSSFSFRRENTLAKFSNGPSPVLLTGHPWDSSRKSCPTFPTWGSIDSPPSLSRHLQPTYINEISPIPDPADNYLESPCIQTKGKGHVAVQNPALRRVALSVPARILDEPRIAFKFELDGEQLILA